jgi:nucleoid DNA-binding protein
MNKIENQDLIKEYYESIKDKYPNLTFDQLKEAVSTPFEMLKEEMASGELKTVRLKYLGTFLVYPKRVKAWLEHLKQRFKLNKVDRREYFETKSMIEKFLENEEDNS